MVSMNYIAIQCIQHSKDLSLQSTSVGDDKGWNVLERPTYAKVWFGNIPTLEIACSERHRVCAEYPEKPGYQPYVSPVHKNGLKNYFISEIEMCHNDDVYSWLSGEILLISSTYSRVYFENLKVRRLTGNWFGEVLFICLSFDYSNKLHTFFVHESRKQTQTSFETCHLLSPSPSTNSHKPLTRWD